MASRPQIMVRETYQTFQIADSGGRTYDKGEFETLELAILHGGVHKSKFFVRVTDTLTGAVILKFYQVRQKSKGVARYSDYQTRIVRDTYAEHLFDLDGSAL